MTDPLSQTVDAIRKEAGDNGIRLFYGYVAEKSDIPFVHWNRERGGDWKKFLVSAKAFNTRALCVNWDSFEQNEIDDSIANLESTTSDNDPENKEEAEQTKQLTDKIRAFQSKVGLTWAIDLAFIANAVDALLPGNGRLV
jgi:hypothetical protein